MAKAHAQYTRELRKRFGYCATWLPTVEVRLGDVGVLEGYRFERVATLADFDLDFEVRTDSATAQLDYTSEGSVSFRIKAAGEVPTAASALTQVDAGISISFSAEHAVLFQAAECTTSSIENRHRLALALLQRFEDGQWPKRYVVVTSLVRALRTTILISAGRDAGIDLRASADVSLGEHSLADADAGLEIVSSRGVATRIVGEGGLTPLFQAIGVKKPFLRGARVTTRSLDDPAPADDENVLGDVGYDTFDPELAEP